MSVNKVIQIGNVGQDPEVKVLENGSTVAKFTLATTKSWKNKQGEWQDDTQWHTVITWRQLAERVGKHIKKGMQVYVEGELTYRKWHKEGEETARQYAEIVAFNVRKLTQTEKSEEAGINKPVNTTAKIENTTTAKGSAGPGEPSDDLPF